MYTNHPDFEAPAAHHLLWRYFDLARYLDLLIREQLFFANVDNMEDPFEGWSTDAGSHRRSSRPNFTVSSWHDSDEENYAMWKIYAQGSAGLAIQTTFQRLRDSFHKTDKPVWIGTVHYYKEAEEMSDAVGSSPFKFFLQKRSIYEYEKEVRCCYQPGKTEVRDNDDGTSDTFNGVYISVDLDSLIDRIYISPYSPDWFRQLIAGVNKKFGLGKPIIHSDVFGGPPSANSPTRE